MFSALRLSTMTTKDRNIPNGDERCMFRKMWLRDRRIVDQRSTQRLWQESSIRWRFELRDRAHGNLAAENHGVGGLVTLRERWTRQGFMISYQRYLILNDRRPMITQGSYHAVPFRAPTWR